MISLRWSLAWIKRQAISCGPELCSEESLIVYKLTCQAIEVIKAASMSDRHSNLLAGQPFLLCQPCAIDPRVAPPHPFLNSDTSSTRRSLEDHDT